MYTMYTLPYTLLHTIVHYVYSALSAAAKVAVECAEKCSVECTLVYDSVQKSIYIVYGREYVRGSGLGIPLYISLFQLHQIFMNPLKNMMKLEQYF